VQVILDDACRGGGCSGAGPRQAKRLVGRMTGTASRREDIDAERVEAQGGDQPGQSAAQLGVEDASGRPPGEQVVQDQRCLRGLSRAGKLGQPGVAFLDD
jgi:hypothetical protein